MLENGVTAHIKRLRTEEVSLSIPLTMKAHDLHFDSFIVTRSVSSSSYFQP